jgi:TonB-linked SusC/RagA family outer membrane protein
LNTVIRSPYFYHMKKIILLIFILLQCLYTFGQKKTENITISVKNTPLKELIKTVEKQSNYTFMYNNGEINLEDRISVDIKNQSIEEAMQTIFTSRKIKFEILGNQIILSKPTKQNAKNSNGIITAIVTDQKGEPIIGASVMVKGTRTGTITNLDGRFSLETSDQSTLSISYLGYTPLDINAGSVANLSVKLKENAKELDEVVVVGYGTQRKKDLTGGITTLSGNKLDKIVATNVASRLQGQIAGVTITNSGNAPGDVPKIRIRGQKSLSGSNDPLIVLDGIIFNGSLSAIDQNSIEDITVLKDASSAAIYGSLAANGVLLITTKKGVIGKTVIRYSSYSGFQTAEKLPNLMNGPENIQLLKDYRQDRKYSDYNTPETWLFSALVDNYKSGKETDWLKEVFRPAFQQEHQVSLSGATETFNYYTSLTYANQKGVVKNSGFEKYAGTLNLSQRLGSWLKIGANFQLNKRGPKGNTPYHGYAYRMSPYGNVRDDNGKYTRYPLWTETMYYSPFADQDAIIDNDSRSIYTSAFAEIQLPVKGLSYRSNFGNSYRQNEAGSYYGSSTMTGAATNGVASISNSASSDWSWENLIYYKLNIKKHRFDFTGLYSAQKAFAQSSAMTGKGFLSDGNAYHNIDMAQGEKTIESDRSQTSMLSYMGRINYGFDNKYMLTVSTRRDGYSAFGENNKWATFPAIAGAWVATEESFVKNLHLKSLDLLKFRLSYGANGNKGVGAYETLTKMTQQDYIYGDGSTFSGGLVNGFTFGNPNLKWETTYSTNFGLDLGLFNNRINVNLDYYITNTSDLLMSRTVAIMNGYSTLRDNVGKTKNNGFELMLSSKNIATKNFQWNSTLSLAGNWSKIVALREDGKDDTGNSWFIGKPISVYYDYRVDGIWQTEEKDEAAKYKAVPGDAKLFDKTADGKMTADDRLVIGSRLPVWTAGFTNRFNYKNWSLSIFLSGIFDVTKENETVKFERQLFDKNTNYIKEINYWTPERQSNEYTRLGYSNSTHNFYTDGSYLRIQDINIGYQFPEKVTSLLNISGLSAYVSIKNLHTFSKASKYTTNIEQDKYSLDASGYPTPRTIVFGVNLNL